LYTFQIKISKFNKQITLYLCCIKVMVDIATFNTIYLICWNTNFFVY